MANTGFDIVESNPGAHGRRPRIAQVDFKANGLSVAQAHLHIAWVDRLKLTGYRECSLSEFRNRNYFCGYCCACHHFSLHDDASSYLSIFIGELDDIPDITFGEGLPNRRDWATKYFKFSDYVIPFDPEKYSDRQAIRKELGYSKEEKVLLVTVGGTSIGHPLIEKCQEF